MCSDHIPSNFKYLIVKSTSPNCDFCGVIENIYHILIECDRNIRERQYSFGVGFEVEAGNSILADPLSEDATMLCRLLFVIYQKDTINYVITTIITDSSCMIHC